MRWSEGCEGCEGCEGQVTMADDNTIIEGSVKFREGKKWKSRWCVMRRLSPVADCVQLQVYAEAGARRAAGRGAGGSKASLSLEQFVGAESGFTLDKQSNTLALVCRDLVALLAFDTRERLLQWQVKARAALGESRQRLVIVASAPKRGSRGPARLHVRAAHAALTAGVPPRLLGLWELHHLRRYGVVEGRFCFEGGSHCGKGEGLHVLVTDQAHEIARDFELATRGRLSPARRPSIARRSEADGGSPESHKAYRPDTRLSELSAERPQPPAELRLRDARWAETGRDDDAASLRAAPPSPWDGVALQRCVSCMSKLGALSRSSTAALTPGARHFSPAWTMEALGEAANATRGDAGGPEGPTRVEQAPGDTAPMPLPTPSCSCNSFAEEPPRAGVGPYENYDIPRVPCAEVDGEYYDTPKRLRECLDNDLFRVTRGSASDAIILRKPCGCLLKVGRRRTEPIVVETEESFQPADCPCRKVTDWANAWIKLPYCRRDTDSGERSVPNKENVTPNGAEGSALYATVDVARKIRRKSWCEWRGASATPGRSAPEIDDGPLAHYENLSFALSLEHYENAKDLLRRAGITQAELDAIGASLKPSTFASIDGGGVCARCGHPPHDDRPRGGTSDEYLLMEPKIMEGGRAQTSKVPPAGYTPMSPIGNFAFHTLRHPTRGPVGRLLEEKSASNPTLCSSDEGNDTSREVERGARRETRVEYRKRSSSADSSRFLEDVEEFEGSVGSRGSASSSLETLRDAAADRGDACVCARDAERKHSDVDSFEASKGVAPPTTTGTNRDSSSSNDSGVSSCSLRRGADFELPRTSAAARRHWRLSRRERPSAGAAPSRRTRSQGPPLPSAGDRLPPKSSSAEAEVPVLLAKPQGAGAAAVADTHSTSSGASDMSDYVETLSLCSSHSSSDTPVTMRARGAMSLLRPRSGREYLRVPRAPPRPPRTPLPLYSQLP